MPSICTTGSIALSNLSSDKLITAGQEDGRRVAQRQRRAVVVGLPPGDGVERPDAGDTQLPEHLAMQLATQACRSAAGTG